jgi:hypothetical protein
MTRKGRIILAGYLVRFPIGGYAWQTAHYLLGLKSLGYDVWFYEDSDYYSPAYNPVTKEFGPSYAYGIKTAGTFLDSIGFGNRWCFIDSQRGVKYGPGAGRIDDLLREADLLINVGGVNQILLERRAGRRSIYVDLDPGYTQLRLVNGDETLRALLNEHHKLFSFGENIGKPCCTTPTGGLDWISTRQPVALEFWANSNPPGSSYTTVGAWNSLGRDLTYQGKVFHWSKRREWLRLLELPGRTGASFELAMDVWSVPGDSHLLTLHGWKLVHPEEISVDPWRYRDYIISKSRAEFTVAKDMNIRLRTGWFSDRAACYLAAGRPVVEQDTGFGETLTLGPGLQAFLTLEQAAEAVALIEADYARASHHAAEAARNFFAANQVLDRLLCSAHS